VRAIGYGAMLAEGFVALIALVTVMIVVPDALKGKTPGTIYGNGIGEFLTLIIGRENLPFAVTFGAMAFSTFVFDTIDVATRLGRLLVQELIGMPGRAGALVATAATIAVPVYFALFAGPGSWTIFWTLFGASNQLLAALTLLSITVWLRHSGKPTAFTFLPTVFMLAITLWALGVLVVGNAQAAKGFDMAAINAVAALALMGLAIYLVVEAIRGHLAGKRTAAAS
jgi:carbon starvation protein